MNVFEFHKNMEKAMGKPEQTTKEDAKATVKVIKQFCNELLEEISKVLNDKVSTETNLIVADLLKELSNGYSKTQTIEGMGNLFIYELAIGKSVTHTKVIMPTPNDEEKGDDEKEN